ncbi:thioredoxin domain-containing protein [uncultured Brachybacterium sp.]|uniref:DsbA family protein n=1 Tax=uncultured Brachybacterium sp. TaxID=189680 RepID=UPI00261195F7|nr:thioredoxin domain-containing protein [uncultured Brachybacterium sp.]
MDETTMPDPGGGRPHATHRRPVVPVAIVAVTALLIAAVLWLPPGDGQDEVATDPSAPSADVEAAPTLPHPSEVALPDLTTAESREAGDLLAEGPVDALVVMVVFTDYQCPYCARWSHDTLPALREYVERGELRIEWRDVNVYGEDSERAARAALAAAMQGRHTEYQQALFDGGEIRSSAQLDEQALIALAEELGLDTEQFTTDLRSEQVARTITEHAAQGIELGAVTTPSFVIGGTPSVGAQPTAYFVTAVDEALEKAGP